jgi:hypothetical protein
MEALLVLLTRKVEGQPHTHLCTESPLGPHFSWIIPAEMYEPANRNRNAAYSQQIDLPLSGPNNMTLDTTIFLDIHQLALIPRASPPKFLGRYMYSIVWFIALRLLTKYFKGGERSDYRTGLHGSVSAARSHRYRPCNYWKHCLQSAISRCNERLNTPIAKLGRRRLPQAAVTISRQS